MSKTVLNAGEMAAKHNQICVENNYAGYQMENCVQKGKKRERETSQEFVRSFYTRTRLGPGW